MTVVRIDAEPRVIVAPTPSGRYEVTFKPFYSCPELERAFPLAWEALEYAELLHFEFGWPVIDRSGGAA